MADSGDTKELKKEIVLECPHFGQSGDDMIGTGNFVEIHGEKEIELPPPIVVQPNPFAIKLVVETIAEFLTFIELRNVRLVSKLWSYVSSEEVKNRKTLTIKDKTNRNRYLDKLLKTPIKNLRQYGKCCMTDTVNLSDFDRNPRYFQLLKKLGRIHTLTDFILSALITVPMFHKIMRTIGHHLTHLEIYLFLQEDDDGTVSSPKYFPICEENSQKHIVFPNMLKFTPGMVSLPAGSQLNLRSAVGTSLADYTRNFPNLVEFAPLCLPEVDDPKLLQKFQLPKLRLLRISTMSPEGLRMSDVNNLLELGFNIKVLEVVNANARNPDIGPLKKFLEAQSGSLEYVKLLCESSSEDLNFGKTEPGCIAIDQKSLLPQKTIGSLFPMCEFPKIDAFQVDKTYVNNLAHILQAFPNMSSLHLNTRTEVKWANICPKSIKVFKSLDNLKFNRISPQDFGVIANPKHFPNLTRIIIVSCADDTFRKVIELTPKLVCFACGDNVKENLRITDEGVTGIKNISSIELNFDHDTKMVEYQRSWPYIGNCSELEELNLTVTGDHAGEKSILYGVLFAPKLIKLEIQGMKISNDLITLLKRRHFILMERNDVANSYSFLNSTKIEGLFDIMKKFEGFLK